MGAEYECSKLSQNVNSQAGRDKKVKSKNFKLLYSLLAEVA